MFIILQFPFVDLRIIQKQASGQFFYPNKFKERTGKKIYYRHFGSKHFRRQPDLLPQSEYCYFDAKKVLKLDGSSTVNCTLVFARLFTEEFFFHFDIGIRVRNDGAQEFDLLEYIEELFKKNIFTAPGNLCGESSLNIDSIKRYIEALYIYATTRTSAYVKGNDTASLTFGSPAVFCQFGADNFIIKNKSLKTANINNLLLYKTSLNVHSTFAHVWIAAKCDSSGETEESLRNLRICLLKLHCYREGLSALFQFLEYNDDLDKLESDILCIEFKYLKNLLKKPKYRGVNGKEIMDMALEGDRTLYNDAWENHIERLNHYCECINDIRKGRSKSVDIHVDNNSNGTVNITTGKNSPISSGSGDIIIGSDLRELMGKFIEEYNKLLAELKLPKEELAMLNSHKDEFNNEVTNAKPEPKKVKSVWEKIKSVFSGIVSNADKLVVLFGLGEKIANLF